MGVFTILKAILTPYDWDFVEASSSRHDQILILCLAPLLSLWRRRRGCELKILRFLAWLGLSGDQSPSKKHPGIHLESSFYRDFPGSPVVTVLSVQRALVWPLIKELRFHMQ